MQAWKFHTIISADMTYVNPMNPRGFDELADMLNLPEGARVLDIACGKGEALLRIASRYPIAGVAVDLSPDFVAAAQAASKGRIPENSSIEFIEQDGATYQAPDGSFDVAMCIGATAVFGGHRGTVRRLATLVKPGGLVLVGVPYWMSEPDPAYLAASSLTKETYGTHADNAAAGAEEGLSLLYTLVSSQADWDRYEGRRWRATELYAVDHPDDEDLPEILARVHRMRDAYLRWGRDCQGWSIYLFRKP